MSGHILHVVKNLLFVLRNFRDVASVLMSQTKEVDDKLRRLNRLIAHAEQKKAVESLRILFIEFYAEALLDKMETTSPTPSEIIRSASLYKEALSKYHIVLAFERARPTRHLPRILFRAALCCCRLSDFAQAQSLLSEAIKSSSNAGHREWLRNVLGATLILERLTQERNVWKTLADVKESGAMSLEDEEFLDRVNNAMKGVLSREMV